MKKRKFNRKLLNFLPQPLKLFLMRRNIRVDSKWPSPNLEIKIADTAEELESAYKLLHDSYVKTGFMNPDPTGLRVLSQHLLPQTSTIVAKWDSKVIGTLSLIRDNPFGLPLEKIFDLSSRRNKGRRLAEVSSLAVDPNYRGQINVSLFPLFRFVYQYARDCFGIDEFVIAVNPNMVDMYLAFMCFEKLKAKAKPYDFVNGASAVGLFLDFKTINERLKTIFNHRPDFGNFYKYWSELPTDVKNKMPSRNYHTSSDPILTPYILESFFLDRAQLGKKLSYQEIQVLINSYPFPKFQKVLLPLQLRLSRKNFRHETQMKAELGKEKIPVEVLNVSEGGLLIRFDSDHSKFEEEMVITVWLNHTTSTTLLVEGTWSPKNGLLGLHIIVSTEKWRLMIESLEQGYSKQAA